MADPQPEPRVINIHDAETYLSRYLERVEGGEEIVIGRAGRPIARLIPFGAARRPRRLGGWAGRVEIAPDFDAPLPDDVIAAFGGEVA